jgi:hypothetical protein
MGSQSHWALAAVATIKRVRIDIIVLVNVTALISGWLAD